MTAESKSEFTNNVPPSTDQSPWRGTHVKSLNSKDEFTPVHNPGRDSIMSAARSENHIIEKRFEERKASMIESKKENKNESGSK